MFPADRSQQILSDLKENILTGNLPLSLLSTNLFLSLASSPRITQPLVLALLEQKNPNFKLLLIALTQNPSVKLLWLFEKRVKSLGATVLKNRESFSKKELFEIWPKLDFLKHVGTPTSFLEQIYLELKSSRLLTAIAGHPNLPPSLISDLLAQDNYWEIIFAGKESKAYSRTTDCSFGKQ